MKKKQLLLVFALMITPQIHAQFYDAAEVDSLSTAGGNLQTDGACRLQLKYLHQPNWLGVE